jgi:uncharacterized Fe-S cluster protein YjdI
MFPKLKKKLKGLHYVGVVEIQEAVTDELKKFQKEEFSAAFQKLYNHAKACIYANGAYFELKKKKGMYLPHVSSIFKKISPKTFWTALCTHKAYALITLSKLRSQLTSYTGCSYVVYQVRLK